MSPVLTVIIPCLNEAESLPRLLSDLAAQRGISLDVIVADGGSDDGSADIARAGGAHIVESARGRARQMNAGAAQAGASWLLFLHADSRMQDPALLANALQALEALEAQSTAGQPLVGHFALKFLRDEPSHAMAWRYVEEKTALNRPYCFNGDQGLLISRAYFDALGGFDTSLPFLEDQQIAARIRANGRLVTLPGTLYSAARRFEQAGFHRQYLLMALIMAMHAAGAETFFKQARGLYRAQHEATRLHLLPFFRLARDCARNQGRWQTWLAIGKLGRENWWQLFYFIDIALRPWLGSSRYPGLRFYERVIEPFTANRFCDAFAAIVLWLHFHLIVLPWAGWQDRKP